MKAVVRIVGGGLVMLFAFTAIYVAAFHAPRAKGFDVGVVGTPAAATQLQSALDGEDRGAFDVRGYDTERDARSALLDTDVHAVVAGRSHPRRRGVGPGADRHRHPRAPGRHARRDRAGRAAAAGG